ncbi:MAG: 4Fe-4S dicluster domain-containing protein [Planctomycetes bacterium]|nr:4Fe-4S dicluster domain-containing protein [Planctomycetota bacterium]
MTGARHDRPWRSPAEFAGTLPMHDPNEAIRDEWLGFPDALAATSRRSFLKLAGFGALAATAACSRAPIEKAIPLLIRPESIVPGKSYWIATTCGGCSAGCGVLARCRDGRPQKLEGHPGHPIGRGGLCAAGQAELLSLHDRERLATPLESGRATDLATVDAAISGELAALRAGAGRVRVLTATETSPSARAAIARFLAGFKDGRHVEWDADSRSAALAAHAATHGLRALPRLRLDGARSIVAIDDDFLGAGVSPVEHTAGRRAARDPAARERFARHVQLESRMTLTGSRADRRVKLAPWEIGAVASALATSLAARAGVPPPAALPPAAEPVERPLAAELLAEVERLAGELWEARGAAVVLCGCNDLATQKLVNSANELLGAYGTTLDLHSPSRQRNGDDAALARLRQELAEGAVDLLLVAGCDPVADLPDGEALAESLKRVPLLIACSTHVDATTALARFALPLPHALEAWDDIEAVSGVVSFRQPIDPPLLAARSLRRTLASWSGDARDDRELVAASYSALVAERGAAASAATFEQALAAGFVELPRAGAAPVARFDRAAAAVVVAPPPADGRLGLLLHRKVAFPLPRHAQNPWLQELPDPVSKVVWDNYAALAPSTAARLGIATGDVVRIEAEPSGAAVELPALVQPGQHGAVVAVALGYGRRGTERFARAGPKWLEGRPTTGANGRVGVAVESLLADVDGCLRGDIRSVKVTRTGRRHELACTQDHHSLSVPEHLAPEGGATRDAVQSVSLVALVERGGHARVAHAGSSDAGHDGAQESAADAELWSDDHSGEGPRWGMAIDLAACTGCSACVVGCQAENNVPVVGRDEVRRHREMSWIRIDRYWQGDPEAPTAHHQPMMCQQCGHAPCETVCPVLATVHSSDGLNQQVYNRCVGTRYCANNCPYKVRRFNWFDYPRDAAHANLALNPDVTVRSRGVMEKCSFCVQRILAAKLDARADGRPLADGDVQPACQQSCPAQAIVFGDLRDPDSRVSRLAGHGRAYSVLEELNVRPAVRYLADVRDPGEVRDA